VIFREIIIFRINKCLFKLKKLQITLTSPLRIDAYEITDDGWHVFSGIKTFRAGTVFSNLKRDFVGRISGDSGKISGKHYHVMWIPGAETWTRQRNDKQAGYFHGERRNTKRRNTKRRNTKRMTRKSRLS